MSSMGRSRGFTLIEVVVAFAILALSLGALYESFGGALRRSAASRNAELAALKAESLLAEFRGSGGLLPDPRNGRDDDLGFEWRVEAKPYPAELSEQSRWRAEAVIVKVTWKELHAGVVLESVELVRKATP
jgi:general secretion pathway protein I